MKIARTRVALDDVDPGPGHVPLKPRASTGSFWRRSCADLVDRNLEDLDVAVDARRLDGWLPPPSRLAPSPSRNRSTTASALASWSLPTGGAEPDGAGEWPIAGLPPAVPTRRTTAPGDPAPGEPAAFGGARSVRRPSSARPPARRRRRSPRRGRRRRWRRSAGIAPRERPDRRRLGDQDLWGVGTGDGGQAGLQIGVHAGSIDRS